MKTNQELDLMGIELSQKLQWNGDEILRVMMAALEDANFHRECAIVKQMLDAVETHDDANYELKVTPIE